MSQRKLTTKKLLHSKILAFFFFMSTKTTKNKKANSTSQKDKKKYCNILILFGTDTHTYTQRYFQKGRYWHSLFIYLFKKKKNLQSFRSKNTLHRTSAQTWAKIDATQGNHTLYRSSAQTWAKDDATPKAKCTVKWEASMFLYGQPRSKAASQCQLLKIS